MPNFVETYEHATRGTPLPPLYPPLYPPSKVDGTDLGIVANFVELVIRSDETPPLTKMVAMMFRTAVVRPFVEQILRMELGDAAVDAINAKAGAENAAAADAKINAGYRRLFRDIFKK